MYDQIAAEMTYQEHALAARIGWGVILAVMFVTMIVGAYLGYTNNQRPDSGYGYSLSAAISPSLA